MRSLTAWLEDDYCSITIANHWLITVIRFVAKSYTHPWKDFANRLHLVLHACEILFSGNVRVSNDKLTKQGHYSVVAVLLVWPEQPWPLAPPLMLCSSAAIYCCVRVICLQRRCQGPVWIDMDNGYSLLFSLKLSLMYLNMWDNFGLKWIIPLKILSPSKEW